MNQVVLRGIKKSVSRVVCVTFSKSRLTMYRESFGLISLGNLSPPTWCKQQQDIVSAQFVFVCATGLQIHLSGIELYTTSSRQPS